MQGKDFIIGNLNSSGYLETESAEILHTKIPRQAAQSPESAILKVATEDVGKMSILRGKLSGNVLYSAQIVEIMSPVTSMLMEHSTNKSVVSFAELQNELSEIASKVIETPGQKKLCALVIGHKKRSPGGVNANANLTEFHFQ